MNKEIKINSKNVDTDFNLEKSSIEDVLSKLEVDKTTGLSTKEAKNRLQKYGPNALEYKEESFWSKVLHHFMGPIAYMIEAAAIVSALIGHWQDFTIIVTLLLFNVAIETWQDKKASTALAALKKGLAPEATVLRDSSWKTIPASEVVPGDIVKIRLGMIVPADLRLIDGEFASIDQAALTGESLPVSKKIGDEAYSGSVVKQGEMDAVCIATGSNTFFGKTAKLVANANSLSHAQKAMFQIGNFLIVTAVILATIMVGFRIYNDLYISNVWGINDALNILQFVLVLLVASIPVAMPTVFSVTLALGALELSKEKAIVSKLSAIEEMAGVDILCSDKTGTLTKNQLSLGDPILFDAKNAQECILAASLASKIENNDPIDTTIINALENKDVLKDWKLEKFIPFDPVTKRTEATVIDSDGIEYKFSKGAPQAIGELCNVSDSISEKIKDSTDELANRGYRALAVAKFSTKTSQWEILGILSMFDPPRDDSKLTIEKAAQKGVSIKMITGDDTAIAIETARQLNMGTNILNASDVFPKDMDPDNVPDDIAELIENADGFARVFPEHKYAIVKALQKRGHIVAMTGDGVNDAPALKQADCGTAVSAATDAARGAADLILTEPGLSVINSAINESRKIFERITSYTIYRVALTMTIMFLVVISSIMYGFQPLTAVMIVVISLLDDIPIMAIAYDNTNVDEEPIRWKISKLISISAVIGFFAVIQSILALVIGIETIKRPELFPFWNVTNREQLQTIMFLQLVTGGHLLLFVTRSKKWFFSRPYPSKVLANAIIFTQIIAIIMVIAGFLVPPINIKTTLFILAYDVVWMFILSFIRIGIEKYVNNKTKLQVENINIVNKRLDQ